MSILRFLTSLKSSDELKSFKPQMNISRSLMSTAIFVLRVKSEAKSRALAAL